MEKKKDFLSELEKLNAMLIGSKNAFEYVMKTSPNFKPQLEQVEG